MIYLCIFYLISSYGFISKDVGKKLFIFDYFIQIFVKLRVI